jgi:hypothetical protein
MPLGALTPEQQERLSRLLTAYEAGELFDRDQGRKQRTGYPSPFRLGKAASTISAGGSGSVDIWKGSTSTGGTGETVTAHDWLGTGATNGANVHLHRNWPTGEHFLSVASTGVAPAFSPESASWFARWDSTGFRSGSLIFARTSTSIFKESTSAVRQIETVGGGVFMWGMLCQFQTGLSSTMVAANGYQAFVEASVQSTGFNGRSDGRRVEFGGVFETTDVPNVSVNNNGDMGAVTYGNTIFGTGSTSPAAAGGYGVGAFAKGGDETGTLRIEAWVTKIAD